jgi:hypothetical protein
MDTPLESSVFEGQISVLAAGMLTTVAILILSFALT